MRKNNDIWSALSQLYDLSIEIREMENRLGAFQEGMGVSGVSYDGVGSGKTNDVSSPTETYALTDLELRKELEDMLGRQKEARIWLVVFVKQVPDTYVRRATMAHFYDGLSWDETADRLGGRAVGTSVRDRCKRFYDTYVESYAPVVPNMLINRAKNI